MCWLPERGYRTTVGVRTGCCSDPELWESTQCSWKVLETSPQPGPGPSAWKFCHGLEGTLPIFAHFDGLTLKVSRSQEAHLWRAFSPWEGYCVTGPLYRCSSSRSKFKTLMMQIRKDLDVSALCIERMRWFSDFLWMWASENKNMEVSSGYTLVTN